MTILWAVNGRDGSALPLKDKEVHLYYTCERGRFEADFEIQGTNVVAWNFLGKNQRTLGDYSLSLEILQSDGKRTIKMDKCNAFSLVGRNCEELYDNADADINEGGELTIVSNLDIYRISPIIPYVVKDNNGIGYWYVDGVKTGDRSTGESAYEYALTKGFEGTEEEFAALTAKLPNVSAELAELSAEIEHQGIFIEDLMNTKIDRENDDYYPKMAVGLADNLSGVDVVDSEVNFRRSGGGAITDGVARVQSIKGNSVVWNQLWDVDGDNRTDEVKSMTIVDGKEVVLTITSNGAFSRIRTPYAQGVVGHRYFVAYAARYNSKSENSSLKSYVGFSLSYANQMELTDSYAIYSGIWVGDYAGLMSIGITGTRNEGDVVAFKDIQVIDLTQMFGAGNEPTTIEEFYARIPMGVDFTYNEGEVISMRADGIKSVGRNQWDEQWELGTIDSNTGVETSNSSTIRSKNFIKVLPSCDYYMASPVNEWVLFYDEKKVFVDKYWAGSVKTFTTPANCHYLKFRLPASYGTTYKNDICINLSDTDFNGQYEPYIEDSEDLSMVAKYFPNGMRSAESAYDEIRYNKATNRWERVIRIATNDMGSFSWSYQPKSDSYPHGFFYTNLNSDLTDMKHGAGVLCKLYSKGGFTDDKSMASNASNNMIYVRDSAYSDVASFKAAMSGVMLYYELAEPIVTEIEDKYFNLDYKVWNCGTEQMVATEPSAPLAADITYGFNAIGKIKELESLVAALRAKVGI